MTATDSTCKAGNSTKKHGTYERPRLEDFLEDTIPPVGHIDTEIFFRRVTEETLGCIRPEYGPLVLDTASGMGIDSCILSSRGFEVVALEPMGKMVGYSLHHHGKEGQYSMHLRGYAEEMPLRDECLDQVLCKGSLDHFVDPRAALAEMRRVLKPGGRFVVAAANYDSLSCYFSRLNYAVLRLTRGPMLPGAPRPHHEIPTDHYTRFNAKVLRRMVREYFEVRREIGIGILWGTPCLNILWDRMSPRRVEKILNIIYDAARRLPFLADMIVLDCVKL